MGGGASKTSVGSKGKLHDLQFGAGRVPFKKNMNKQGDSDYDDEDDSKIESLDD